MLSFFPHKLNEFQFCQNRLLMKNARCDFLPIIRLWSFITAIIFLILFFSACTLVNVKLPGDPLPKEELNIRILTRDFAKDFARAVEETADTIIDEAHDPAIEANALRWKLNATAEVQNAVFQPIPSLSLIDTWILCVQMASFFNAGNGQTLFGGWQSSVCETADRLQSSIESLGRSAIPEEKFLRYQQFVGASAKAMPVTSLSFYRESILSQWARYEGKDEQELMKTVGTAPEVLEDFINQLSFYELTVPKRLQWSTELYMLESGMGERIDSQMAALNASSSALVASAQQAVTSFTRIERRMIELADESPELLDTALMRMSTDIAPVMEKLNTNWGSTIELMDQINLQWDATLDVLSTERQALVDDLQKERSEVVLEVDRLIERSLVHLKRAVTQWIIFVSIFAVLILSISFFMGYLVGKARRKKTQ